MFWKQSTSVIKRGIYGIVLCLCFVCSYGCSIPNLDLSSKSLPSFDIDLPILGEFNDHLQEVAPPELIQTLKADLSTSTPKVEILEPTQGSTWKESDVEVKLNIAGLKLFRDADLKLGPHIALLIDDREPIEVHSVSQSITLKELQPGSHTLRAIAEYPWHESFKNASAYDQVGFDVFTSSRQNAAAEQPVLSTSSIQSTYSSEPVLVDFVVRQASINSDTEKVSTAASKNIQVKATINDQSFTIPESEASIYIEGLKEGTNWLKLELEDNKGKFKSVPFSEQAYQFEFNPDKTNSLGQLTSGSINLPQAGVIVGRPKPIPPKPKTTPTSVPSKATETPVPSAVSKPNLKQPEPKKVEAPKAIQKTPVTSSSPPSAEIKKIAPPKAVSPSRPMEAKKEAVEKNRPQTTSTRPQSSKNILEQSRTSSTSPYKSRAAKESPASPTKRTETPISPNNTGKPTESHTTINQTPVTAPKSSSSGLGNSGVTNQKPLNTPSNRITENKTSSSITPTRPTSNQSKPIEKKGLSTQTVTPATQTVNPKTTEAPSKAEELNQKIKSATQEAQDKVNETLKGWRDRVQSMTDKGKISKPKGTSQTQETNKITTSETTKSEVAPPGKPEVDVVKLKVPEKS